MNTYIESCESHLVDLSVHYDPETLFDDFLTFCICKTRTENTESAGADAEVLTLLRNKYAGHHGAGKLEAARLCLLAEMARDPHPNAYHDMLGDFYEDYLYHEAPQNSFYSWYMIEDSYRDGMIPEYPEPRPGRHVKVFDELCASGRRLLARRWIEHAEGFYGLEIRPLYGKMTILNLYLNGIPKGEVLVMAVLSDTLSFHSGYRYAADTKGIIEISNLANSAVWEMQKADEWVYRVQ